MQIVLNSSQLIPDSEEIFAKSTIKASKIKKISSLSDTNGLNSSDLITFKAYSVEDKKMLLAYSSV